MAKTKTRKVNKTVLYEELFKQACLKGFDKVDAAIIAMELALEAPKRV